MRTRIQALKKLEGDDSDQTLDDDDRIPFNIDLAVILAGFAFEAYNTPVSSFYLFPGLIFPLLIVLWSDMSLLIL